MEHQNQETVGLLAGWGRYPVLVAQALTQRGYRVACAGLAGHADPILGQICHSYQVVGPTRLGSQIRFFRRQGVQHAMMAGKVFKLIMFQRLAWLKLLPDLTFLKYFLPIFVTNRLDRRDDTVLTMLTKAYSRFGIEFVPATDFAPELLVDEGVLTRRPLTDNQQQDIAFGWHLAKEIGRLDIGQSVAVKSRAVLSVEAIEGTDECIRRAGVLCPVGGFTLVKVAKPQQDLRFDMPTVGVGTIKAMRDAGGRVLAVEADKTIILDQAEVIRLADRYGITLVALRNGEQAMPLSAA